MKVDIIDPSKLAAWLNVTINQRTRQQKLLEEQFGKTSAAATAVAGEITEIRQAQGACLQALTDAPLKR